MARRGYWAGVLAGCLLAGSASAQVIPPVAYRPPQTVQIVPIPLPPDNHRLQVLIITGRNSYEHDWRGTTAVLRRQLEGTGRFEVHVTEEFRGAAAETLKPYDVVLLNYLGRWNYDDPVEHRWGAVPEKALFDYVRNGGGLVVYHASLNMGAPSWPEFEALAGGVMRGPPTVSRRSPPNAFRVHIVDRDHPVTKGMREYFWTLDDDMYVNMKWDPSARIHVLATAHDNPADYEHKVAGPKYPLSLYAPDKVRAMQGMDQDHPQVWTVDYGKGRVFAIGLGHGPDTLAVAGVESLINRGTEWAATGKVTVAPEVDAQAFDTAP